MHFLDHNLNGDYCYKEIHDCRPILRNYRPACIRSSKENKIFNTFPAGYALGLDFILNIHFIL